MNQRYFSTAVAVSFAIWAPAFAGDSPSFTPREMAHCMMKRLRADTSLSYRDALKVCKEQFASAPAETSITATNAEGTKKQAHQIAP